MKNTRLDNMNTVFISITVFTIYLAVSKCYHYQFPVITVSHYYVPIVNIRDNNESIIFVKENNIDNMLINSVLLDLYPEQPVTLIRNISFKVSKRKHFHDPNVVILTESLCRDAIHTTPLKYLVKNVWSPVFFILTARNGNESCENGTFNNAFLETAQDFMNEIWHKYRIVRVIVLFPYTCPYHYIIYGGKKPSSMGLYNRTIKIINSKNKNDLKTAIIANSKHRDLTAGYPLRANLFYRFPTSMTQCDCIHNYKKVNYNYTNGFCGLDALVMNDFMEYYKYNLTIVKDEKCDVYGFVEPDTHLVTGSLGCIIRGEMDVSFNSRFAVPYAKKNSYKFLYFISVDSLSVVMKRPEEIPLWHYAFNTYGPRTGTILCILILVLGVIMWVVAWITKEITGQEPQKLHVYILNAVTCTIFGFPMRRRTETLRVLRGASLFCSIILLAFYQGNVNYRFTTRTRNKEIKTLHELFQSKYVLYTSPSIQTLLMNAINPQDKAQVTYVQRTQIKSETLGIGYILDNQDLATLVRGRDVLIEILQNYTDEAGSPLMYVVDESLRVYYLSFMARSGFVFVDESICFMMRLLEAGLPQKYYLWTRRSLKMGDTYPKIGSEPRPANKICLENLRVAFGILSLGCLLSACSFFVEVYRGKILNDKKVVSPSM